MALVRIRSNYSVREVRCSNYRTFRTSLPTPLEYETMYALWFTWVGYVAAACSHQTKFLGAQVNVYDDNVALVQKDIQVVPSSPIAGFIPLISAIKPELCVGIVRHSPRISSRIYVTGWPHEYSTDTQELNIVGRGVWATVENSISLALDEVLVKWKSQLWEPVSTVHVQPELQTHNHRKVHVPLSSQEIHPG